MRYMRLQDLTLKWLWTPACLFAALTVGVLSPAASTEAKSGYEIINTGIKGGGCWYDDSHFIVVKGQHSPLGKEFEVEGLYYLDPAKHQELKKIDLSPSEPAIQRQIKEVTCQDKTILYYVMAPDRKTSRLYKVKIGGQPELIADMRWARPSAISLEGQYLLGNKLTVDEGVWEEHSDCDVRFVIPALKVLCWPRSTIGQWITPYFVVNEYLWRETILVRSTDGKTKRVPNPEPPLKLADGSELKHGYLLRDLENHVLQQVKLEQPPYQIYRIFLKVNPQGEYLYANCSKAGDHGEKRLTVGGQVCRYKLDGNNHAWEEVFAVQQSPKDPFGLQDLDVNERGDVVVIDRGHVLNHSLWKYTASSRKVEFVTRAPRDLGAPLVSPNGHWISFILRGELHLAHSKGEKP